MLIPVGVGVGVTSVSLGMVRAFERNGLNVNFFKPVAQPRQGEKGPELSTEIIRQGTNASPATPFTLLHAEKLIGAGKTDVLLEDIVERFESHMVDAEIVVVEGLVPTSKQPFANSVNYNIAKALDAEMVFVANPGTDSSEQLKDRLEIACSNFGGSKNKRIIGCVINKVGAPLDEAGRSRPDLAEMFEANSGNASHNLEVLQVFGKSPMPILGCIPWSAELIAPRAKDLANHLKAEILNEGELEERRLLGITFCARSIPNMLQHFRPGGLLVTSGDRADVIVAACLAAMNGVKIGALLLTGDARPDESVLKLCQQAMATGLPIMLTTTNTWQTALTLQNFNLDIPADDKQRIEAVQEYIASHIDKQWIETLTVGTKRTRRLSPPAFRYQLTELARQAKKRVVLPEGEEPRTIEAANICAERGIATPVLVGNPAEIKRVAESQGIVLSEGVEIVDPVTCREKYVAPMVELRKGKGLTEVVAREQLEDNVVLATMMLEQSEVDGLVSGAVHTTANTIRPALQLIKTAPGSNLVSSIFFMLLPDQVLVYGDCAINPDPDASQLADIAIQSADSAKAFGIDPRVAMISYSTGSSGQGSDVEKVREATKIAQERRPDLIIDGPLQYDAAIMENVAKSKAPNSPVAGKATVFVFPDLNTGNTTYKAVQRSANLISIGPMLQGMRKPVNDLSRGALVDDIVYTIALTAIQSKQLTS
ncbi:phosphate acetyltransferase [Moritella viscosa]|uniref:Phosphate acetyltransferase n=1 Tax=Moritella viscosa TaxID=80854 RepID=A0A1K9YW04_9GAMM|nr:phosphate acetyltransferase [Moritella viscosa]SGY86635.1 Phosphate acetyltransferase-Phosphotransacetylase [Moritella viscosa]SGY87930.1 Phosphate acetyltransferase-Phosphotransacetylase [Moritella viscosa]SGY88522.1 Phosphate acetyltransferase-Phosphotransacetylase [Moritella viscosa]SGZ03623.1 Phosphate acetyltransferase-Phosphotransacetylase [Moritella viscosa]SGZ09425.1 Phosphate acetyltransferase-Phosphotransacetylase [Moritella viscosa]